MYNELNDVWKIEKENKGQLAVIPKNFYSRIAKYIENLKNESRMLDKKSTKARLLQKEVQNVTFMINQLLENREKKILKMVLEEKSSSSEVLTEEELKLFNNISNLASSYHDFMSNLRRGKIQRMEKKETQNYIVLRFVQEIPTLVGADMKTYGPFEPEDIATLPIENAKILINKEMAIEIDIK